MSEQAVSPEAQRKRAERARKKEAGFVNKEVALSPFYQDAVREILEHTGIKDFQRLTLDLIKSYHEKVQAHKARHVCCGKCGAPYDAEGSCVLDGDSQCQYSRTSQRNKELKP